MRKKRRKTGWKEKAKGQTNARPKGWFRRQMDGWKDDRLIDGWKLRCREGDRQGGKMDR